MGKSQLKLGNKLELEIEDELYNIKQPLISQYETLLTDGTMEILSPIYKGRVLYIAKNAKINVIYEYNGDLFKFGSIALESKFSDRLAILRIQPVTEEQRLQRRSFFRLNCILDVEYRLCETEEALKENRGEFEKTITKDISGGGICLLTKKDPEYGWFLEGRLKIDQEVHFIGKVVRVYPTENDSGYKFEAGIEFINISDREREKVISFIFDYQRKLLKKGWYTK